MKAMIMTAITLFLSSFALAAPVTLTGQGNASAEADFMNINVSVYSKCYTSAKEVRDSNGKTTNKIKEILENFKADENDKVVVTQGFTQRRNETEYQGNSSVVLCKNGWTMNSQLSLKVTDISVWPELQDAVFAVADSMAEVGDANQQTSVSMPGPTPGFKPATATKLKLEALQAAAKDATEQMLALQQICGFSVVKYLGVTSETQQGFRPSSAKRSFGLESADAGGGVALDFGQQSISQVLSFTWDIKGGGSCVTGQEFRQN